MEINGNPSPVVKSAKGLALLAYLLVTRQAHSREAVAELLWEGVSPKKSLNNLRQLLSRIRKWLPDLQVSATEIAYEASGFVDLYALRQGLTADSPPLLDEALQLYKGELLAGLYVPNAPRFNEWLLLEREQLRQQVVTAYEHLCERYLAAEDWPKGTVAAQRWLAWDDLDERALHYLLQFLAASGQIEQALQQYESSRQRLWAELEVEPEPETVQLVEQLQAQQSSGLSWEAIVRAQVERPSPHELAEPGKLPVNAYVPYQRNNDFTGRKESLLHLVTLLLPQAQEPAQRAVAVTGMGGLGKTQTAVEFCYRYGRFFPGGVFWLSFADGNNVAAEISLIGGERGMGLYRDDEQRSQASRINQVQRAWQEPTPRLLIFDNCEEEALLQKWLPVTGGCRVLVTSRRGEWTHDLQVTTHSLQRLNRDESLQFLQQLVPQIDEAAADAIAMELGDLPLALHLAGGFLRRYRQVTSDDYLQQLRNMGALQHPSLQGRGLSHSPTGHDLNIARTFALNFEQLDRSDEVDCIARQLLVRTAYLVPGEPVPWPILLATAVSDNNDIMATLSAEDGLNRLITLGFLQRDGQQTVVMHRLIAAFAQETADSDKKQNVVSLIKSVVKALRARLNQLGHLGSLPIAASHLRHLMHQALAMEDVTAVRLGTLLGRHLRDIADYENAHATLEQVLAKADLTGDLKDLVSAWLGLARVQRSLGKDQVALESAQQAERLLRHAEPPASDMLVHALHRKGWSLYMLGRAEEAVPVAEEALAISKAIHSNEGMISNLNLLGQIHAHLLDQYEASMQYLDEALVIATTMGNVRAQAALLSNLGETVERQGDFEQARRLYQQALTLAVETGNKDKQVVYQANLGRIQALLGYYDEAVARLMDVITALPPQAYLLAEVNLSLAEAYLGQGQLDLALATSKDGLAQAQSNHKQLELGRAWMVLGRIAFQLKAPVYMDQNQQVGYDAPACFEKALEIFDDMRVKRERALAMSHWGQYELSAGHQEKGEQMIQEAVALLAAVHLTAR